jgi:hypothetical protein
MMQRQRGTIPGRVFLDTSLLQALHTYGSFIYDGDDLEPDARIRAARDGVANLEGLRDAVRVWGGHGHFQLALSNASLREVLDRQHVDFLQWANEMMAYTDDWLLSFTPTEPIPSPRTVRLAAKLDGASFGYLGAKDRQLIKDAVLLDCDVFLTMEGKLPKNGAHIQREVGIVVAQPLEYWRLLGPWAALF